MEKNQECYTQENCGKITSEKGSVQGSFWFRLGHTDYSFHKAVQSQYQKERCGKAFKIHLMTRQLTVPSNVSVWLKYVCAKMAAAAPGFMTADEGQLFAEEPECYCIASPSVSLPGTRWISAYGRLAVGAARLLRLRRLYCCQTGTITIRHVTGSFSVSIDCYKQVVSYNKYNVRLGCHLTLYFLSRMVINSFLHRKVD